MKKKNAMSNASGGEAVEGLDTNRIASFSYIASIVFRGEGGPCPLLKSRSAL